MSKLCQGDVYFPDDSRGFFAKFSHLLSFGLQALVPCEPIAHREASSSSLSFEPLHDATHTMAAGFLRVRGKEQSASQMKVTVFCHDKGGHDIPSSLLPYSVC